MRDYEVVTKQVDIVTYKIPAKSRKKAIELSLQGDGIELFRYVEDTEVLSTKVIRKKKNEKN